LAASFISNGLAMPAPAAFMRKADVLLDRCLEMTQLRRFGPSDPDKMSVITYRSPENGDTLLQFPGLLVGFLRGVLQCKETDLSRG
jgi:hypothetical protein